MGGSIVRIPASILAELMTRILRSRGLSDQHAEYVVQGLITTSLRGIDTHGVVLFPVYVAELEGGRARAQPYFHFTSESEACRVLDADDALGIVAGRVAASEAIRLAKEAGLGAVAVKNSNHFAAASIYTLEMARHDMIGICFSNSDALVAPHRGMRPLFGTNPISFAAPGEDGANVCVDMATSQVAYSKVKQCHELELPVDPSWVVLSSSAGSTQTALKPLGGYKGQCLSMMVEILCCVMTGMPFDHELSHLFAEPFTVPRKISHFFLALDIGAFLDIASFKSRLGRLLTLVRAQPSIESEPVIAPGDLEASIAMTREREGIPLPGELWERLRRLDEQAVR
jgi:ureidoglycolate dehydrogenase (NAD+)